MPESERERIQRELSSMSRDELFELAKERFFPGLPNVHIGVDPAANDGEFTTIVVAVEGDDGVMHVERAEAWQERRAREEAQRRYSNPWVGLRDFLNWQPNVIEGEFVEVETRPERLLDAGESEP